jgi:uncharacterized membrane protein
MSHKRWLLAIYIVIVAIATFTRLHQLGDKGIWLDEGFSYIDARAPMREMLQQRTASADNPPLYFALAHMTLKVADTDAMLRLPSALADIGSLIVLMALAARLFNAPTAILTGVLYALSPMAVQFAQEARPYALLNLFDAATLWLTWELARASTKRNQLIAGGALFISVFGGLLSSYLSLFILPAVVLWFVLDVRNDLDAVRRKRAFVLLGALLMGIALFAWLSGNHPFTNVLALRNAPRNNTFDLSPLLGAWDWANLYNNAIAKTISAILLTLSFVLSLINRRHRANLRLLWIAVLSCCLIILLSAPPIYSRYFVIVLPVVCVLIGHALASVVDMLRRRSMLAHNLALGVCAGALAICQIAPLQSNYNGERGFARDKPQWHAAIQYINSRRATDQVILSADAETYTTLSRYMPSIRLASRDDLYAHLRRGERGYLVAYTPSAYAIPPYISDINSSTRIFGDLFVAPFNMPN